ncbi:pilus assembly protein [Bordetella avium]|uniref:pilus assembly protein n=1 Tax=Bordetella avium TaxID=521 RepID=UPI001F3D85ED|nr:pilus assembly protein [Bordetella avium]WQE34760.1 pilus assembly protein [Bordetella avium]
MLGLLLLSLLLAAWISANWTARLVAARARLTHVADAVAYSGALMQARQLNLLAYIHRAQLGHQVAMAHLVTLIAWGQLASTQGRRRLTGNPPAFLIRRLFGSRFARAYGVTPSGNTSSSYNAAALQASLKRHDAVVHRILADAARQQWGQATRVRDEHMIRILRANYAPGIGVPTMQVLDDNFSRLLAWRSPRQYQGLLAPTLAIMRRFAFLGPRDLTETSGWITQPLCPWQRHHLRRRGKTFLDAQGRWGAHDTLSFHALRSNRWIGCYFREYPMGWAANGASAWQSGRHYVDRPPPDFSSQEFWRWLQQKSGLHAGSGNFLANSYAMRDHIAHAGGAGLPDVLGLARPDAVARFSVRLSTNLAVSDLGLNWSARHLDDAWWRALVFKRSAAAETYFVAPGAGSETPSLFHPYWQARLIAMPATTGVQP